MSTEIQRYEGGTTLPVDSMDDLMQIGTAIAQSGMFGVKNLASGLVVAATCHQQGITLLEFQRTYHIIEGRPSMRADAMLAEFRRKGGKYRILENSMERAAAEFDFEGQKVTLEYTMEDAKRTGDCYQGDGKSIKHTWAKRPDDMLWARLVSRAVRRLAPEINAGLYAPEEVQDFEKPERPEPRNITPQVAAERIKTSAPKVDYTVCPEGCGEYSGRTWSNIDIEILEAALASDNPALTPTHRAAIRAEIEVRKDVQKEEDQ